MAQPSGHRLQDQRRQNTGTQEANVRGSFGELPKDSHADDFGRNTASISNRSRFPYSGSLPVSPPGLDHSLNDRSLSGEDYGGRPAAEVGEQLHGTATFDFPKGRGMGNDRKVPVQAPFAEDCPAEVQL